MAVAAAPIDAVLDSYQGLMRALQTRRAALGIDPWFDCRMSLPQLRALGLIAASERGLSSRELATALGVGASAITPLVDRLVERGLAYRTEDRRDRRIARLHATDTGADFLDRLRADQVDVIRSALSQLDPSELERVGAALELLHTGVERASNRAPTQSPQAHSASLLEPAAPG